MFPTRYFILDFNTSQFIVKHDNFRDYSIAHSKCIIMPFRDLKALFQPHPETDMDQYPNGWYHVFHLETTGRKYCLCAETENHKQMMMDALTYIIHSTKIIQECMHKNSNSPKKEQIYTNAPSKDEKKLKSRRSDSSNSVNLMKMRF